MNSLKNSTISALNPLGLEDFLSEKVLGISYLFDFDGEKGGFLFERDEETQRIHAIPFRYRQIGDFVNLRTGELAFVLPKDFDFVNFGKVSKICIDVCNVV